ncbi:hypothetical protein C8Q80DRAFT_588521 [Daedaleopsis nitida]|nr:hypothetical protein C8Q80DRAFT_588521 [Daedaleopsis nitida]
MICTTDARTRDATHQESEYYCLAQQVSRALPHSPPTIDLSPVSLEYASLRHTGHCPIGMHVIPSPDNVMVWDTFSVCASRLLHRLHPQVIAHLPFQLSGAAAGRAVPH